MDLDTEEKAINEVLSIDIEKRDVVTKKFRNKYVTSFGSATKQSLDLIYKGVKKNDR